MDKFILLIYVTLAFVGEAGAAVLIKTPSGELIADPSAKTLAAAATSPGAAGKTVVVTSAQTLTASLTWPSDRQLIIQYGGLINRGGYTLNIKGNFPDPGPIQVFTGSGKVIFGAGSVDHVRPEWWTTNATPGTTDMSIALAAALATGLPVSLGNAAYYSSRPLAIPADFGGIQGTDPQTSILKFNGTDGLVFAGSTSSEPYSPKVFRDFQILGINTGANYAIKSLGAASVSNKLQHARFENLRIRNWGHGMRFRNMWWGRIEKCVIYEVRSGIELIGQNVMNIIQDNHLEWGPVGGASGTTSAGIYITSASDYGPGGAREHSPEDNQFHKNLIYGFDYGVYVNKATVVRVEDNDIDLAKHIGILVNSIIDGLTIKKNWVGLATTGTYGIRMMPAASPARGPNSIEGNTVSGNIPIAGTMKGISIEKNQQANVSENYLSALNSNGITYDGAFGEIRRNTVDTTGISIYVAHVPANQLVSIDKNVLTTSPVISATQYGVVEIGSNVGVGSTHAEGALTIAAGATSGSQTYSPYYPDFWTIAKSGITPVCRAVGNHHELGEITCVASVSGVSVYTAKSSTSGQRVFYEVVGVPTYLVR